MGRTNCSAAATFPGQAILQSKIIDVFQFTGAELESRGNFFALIFFALGLGSLVVYFGVGWSSNIIAQVRGVDDAQSMFRPFLSFD